MEFSYRVTGLVPITDEEGEVIGGGGEGHGDARPAQDPDAPEAAGRLVEGQGREVEEAADLVLEMHHVGEVLPGWDGAVGPRDAILP